MNLNQVIDLTKQLNASIPHEYLPPIEGSQSPTQMVLANVLVKNTRSYIERIANEINGCYENGWYNACSVMIRRLLETLIVELYESFGLSNKIKNASGDFIYLSGLIDAILSEKERNISRNAKGNLKKLKEIGDLAAHNRRYLANRVDIDNIRDGLRQVVQELLFTSKIKQ